ncbi:MAG: hypothetical protein ACFE85_11830 [Candidatus Hodarchaeota archaeon]
MISGIIGVRAELFPVIELIGGVLGCIWLFMSLAPAIYFVLYSIFSLFAIFFIS